MDIPTINEIYSYIVDALKTNEFAQGGFIIGLLVAFGNQLKKLPVLVWGRLKRLIIYKVNIEEIDELFYYFELWLQHHHTKKYRNVEAALKMDKSREHINRDVISGKQIEEFKEKVIFKQFDDTFYIWRGLRYIRVFKGGEQLENASSMKSAFYNKFQISGIFAKRVINKLIKEVHQYSLDLKKKEKDKNIKVKTSTQYGDWINETVVEPKPLDKIIVEGKEDLLEDIYKFIDSSKWYKDRGILYKRGYMFYGDAGTGKTSFILSLAKHLKKSVNFLQLNNMDDASVRCCFRELKPDSILVIEDIDAAFTKSRETGSKDIKFTFSTLLNCLDGVFSQENVIVIFTTNHPEKLDEALVRSGRIDYKMEFKRPNVDRVFEYINNFYGFTTIRSLGFDNYTCSLPMVDIQNACLQNKDSVVGAMEEILKLDKEKYAKKNDKKENNQREEGSTVQEDSDRRDNIPVDVRRNDVQAFEVIRD